jgi:ribosomal protein S18 acetylase RimI-like enzyme
MTQIRSVRSARPEELEDALRLVFNYLPEDERGQRVANALALIDQGELDPQGVTVVRGKSGLRGAMVTILLPGATGLVVPPRAAPARTQRMIEDQLVRHSELWLRQHGVKMTNALILPIEEPLAAPLLRNGFRHMTSLWYLRHSLGEAQLADNLLRSISEIAQTVSFATYSSSRPETFQETLARTYAGTLDCPEVNGVRDTSDVMQGHREQAHADSRLWWLMSQEDRPAGVLLLTPVPEVNALDISYLGIVPEFRGRRLGWVVTAKAIDVARCVGAAQVTLAVDCRNTPAWNMYIEMGFEAQERREVYLRVYR